MNVNRAIWTTLTVMGAVLGLIVGYVLATQYSQVTIGATLLVPPTSVLPMIIVLSLAFMVVLARLGSWMADHLVIHTIGRIHSLSAVDRVLGIVGALIGLIFGVGFTLPLAPLASEQSIWLVVQFCAIGVCAALGMALMTGMRSEMLRVFPRLDEESEVEQPTGNLPKLLDTNIIIDGRLAALCQTGFLEGPIWVPSFVLNEVQLIADSSDPMRKSKGRRGLDALSAASQIKVQRPTVPGSKENPGPVQLVRVLNEIPISVQSIETVDAKLIALAATMGAAIVTNDFNLKSVAELQGVRILNLNELSQSLKPAVMAGEEMELLLVKEGSHPGQAVGYLEDGTMVVVGEAHHYIGKTCHVAIDRIVQTVTGKMIFADLKREPRHGSNNNASGPGDDLFPDNGNSGNGHGPKKRR